MIKKLRRRSKELEIALFLNCFDDRHNHTVPVLDHFWDELDPDVEYMVMPLLRRFYSPPFFLVSEVVDFVTQTLEVRYIVIVCFESQFT